MSTFIITKTKSLRRALLLVPFAAALPYGVYEQQADAGINTTYSSSTDRCAAPANDCIKIVVTAPRQTMFATCEFITSQSEQYLAQYGDQWVATDAPCE